MTQDPVDYDRCRSCGGPLQILDPNRSLIVTCVECADSYDLDPDVFDDGQISDAFSTPVPHGQEGGDA